MTVCTWVYRAFDADERLLYVGCTKNLGSRKADHRKRAPWYADAVSWTSVEYPTRAGALAAEALAIDTENPVWNVSADEWYRRVVAGHRRPGVDETPPMTAEEQSDRETQEETTGYRALEDPVCLAAAARIIRIALQRAARERLNRPDSVVE